LNLLGCASRVRIFGTDHRKNHACVFFCTGHPKLKAHGDECRILGTGLGFPSA
jgi:hypothetical protein